MLQVGAKFPQFSKDELDFMKGVPTDIPSRGDVTVVELWATWCGPCHQMFPHLSSIASQHAQAGLKVVGISLDEGGATYQLHSFVRSQKMDYVVAAPKVGRRNVGAEIMTAAGISGIPHAFVIDREGVVQFSGHPAQPAFVTAIKTACSAPKLSAASEETEVPKSREALLATPVRELKAILQRRGISAVGAAEKSDLVDLLLQKS